MRNKKIWFTLAILFIQLSLVTTVFSAPAPVISSLEVLAVGTGDINGTVQWTYTSSPYQGSIDINSGEKLYVMTRQMGYDANKYAKFNNVTVPSVAWQYVYDPYPIAVGFIDFWDCGSGNQSGSFTVTANSINTYQEWKATIYVSINPVLSITKLGTGGGDITPDTGSLNWSGNVGVGNYPVNTSVTLLPTASAGSSFDGWSGACTNSSGSCTVTMDSAKSVSATFSVIPNARIGTVPYGTLTNAYNAVAASETIEAKDMTFVENLTVNHDIPFTLIGGYADDYGVVSPNPRNL